MQKIQKILTGVVFIIAMLVAIQGIKCASADIEKTVTGGEEAVNAFPSTVKFWCDVSSYGVNIGAGISRSDFLYKQGEKIDIVLALHNLSAESVPFVSTKVDNDYQVVLNDESGNPVPLTDYGKLRAINVHELNRVVFMSLKPNEIYLDTFPLSEFYDMTRPGLYSISVTRDIWRLGNIGKNDIIHHELGPIWFAIDDGSMQDCLKLSLAKQLAKKLSTSKTPNAMVAVQPSLWGHGAQLKWTSNSTLAVVSTRGFRTAICAQNDTLILGSTRVRMTQKARMIGNDLCLPQDGVAAITDYLSVHLKHTNAKQDNLHNIGHVCKYTFYKFRIGVRNYKCF